MSTPILPTNPRPRYPHEDGWWHQALCGDLPPDAMFPAANDGHAIAYAKEVCAACPVRVQCMNDAPQDGTGIWGGSGTLTIKHRRAAR